jgi:hypothetical protein
MGDRRGLPAIAARLLPTSMLALATGSDPLVFM